MNDSRQYPSRPIVGVGAVVFVEDGRVVLVRRGHEPLAGSWSLPGGAVELGETVEAAVAREILEETGLVVQVGAVIDAVDRIFVDDTGRVEYHFVVIDYLCRPCGGRLVAGSDVAEVAVADVAALALYRLSDAVQAVMTRAVGMNRRGTG